MDSRYFDDPVQAYDLLSCEYSRFSNRRDAYLRGVEQLIIQRIPGDAMSLLDIGAGDGSRAVRIAAAAGLSRVVLLEPSSGMSALGENLGANTAERWPIRAENLGSNSSAEGFDVITCLWNVLGHVRGTAERVRTLRSASQLLSNRGRLFLDVNHRYNAKSYGLIGTCARWAKDLLVHNSANGDVTAAWNVDELRISTYGHVFTDREIRRLAQQAGLEIEDRIVLDYDDGTVRRISWLGNLFYIFRRNSRMDSSSAPATS